MTNYVDVDSWTASGISHMRLLIMDRPMPSPRITGAMLKKSARGRAYGAWRARMRDVARVALAGAEGWPYAGDWQVGAAWSFGARPAAPIDAARRKGGKVDMRRVKSVLDWDYTNCVKAFEDVLKGLLWADDRQVRYSGPGAAIDIAADWLAVHAWTGPPGTDLEWRAAWRDRSVTETVRVK